MNKKEIVEAYAREIDIPESEAAKALDILTDMIERGLKYDGEANIHGFGKFRIVKYVEREGVNPRTGEKMVIKAREAVRFTVSRNMKNRILTARSNEK